MYEYKCTVDRVVDGDTIDVTLDLGFSVLHKTRVRLFGIDTTEYRTRDKDEKDRGKAGLLTRFFDADFPRPFGVFYFEDRPTYEDALVQQIDNAIEHKGQGNLDELLKGSNTWTID